MSTLPDSHVRSRRALFYVIMVGFVVALIAFVILTVALAVLITDTYSTNSVGRPAPPLQTVPAIQVE